MALKAVVTQAEFDVLPADVKKEYTKQSDGSHLLSVEAVTTSDGKLYDLQDVKGMKGALEKERQAVKEARELLKKFDGLDPERAREALTEVEKLKDATSDDKIKAKIESVQRQMQEKHAAELKKRDDEIARDKAQIEKLLIDQAATAVLAAEPTKGSPELLLPHVRQFARAVRRDDGSYVVEIIGKDGTPRISPQANSTSPMSIGELVAEMKTNPVYAPAFEGTGASGSGNKGSFNNKGSSNNNIDLSKLTPVERMQKAQELGINK